MPHIIQNLNMEPNLTDILNRISLKLNRFTEDSTQLGSMPSHGMLPTNTNIEKLHYSSNSSQMNHQEDLKRNSFHPKGTRNGKKEEQRINFSVEGHGKHKEACNKNISFDYQHLQGQRTDEKATPNASRVKLEAGTNAHQETYMFLRRKNKILEDSVKNLQSRLKTLQSGLKEPKPLQSKSSKFLMVKSIASETMEGNCKQMESKNKSEKVISKNAKVKEKYSLLQNSNSKVENILVKKIKNNNQSAVTKHQKPQQKSQKKQKQVPKGSPGVSFGNTMYLINNGSPSPSANKSKTQFNSTHSMVNKTAHYHSMGTIQEPRTLMKSKSNHNLHQQIHLNLQAENNVEETMSKSRDESLGGLSYSNMAKPVAKWQNGKVKQKNGRKVKLVKTGQYRAGKNH